MEILILAFGIYFGSNVVPQLPYTPLAPTVVNYTGGTDEMAAALPYNSPHGSTGGGAV